MSAFSPFGISRSTLPVEAIYAYATIGLMVACRGHSIVRVRVGMRQDEAAPVPDPEP